MSLLAAPSTSEHDQVALYSVAEDTVHSVPASSRIAAQHLRDLSLVDRWRQGEPGSPGLGSQDHETKSGPRPLGHSDRARWLPPLELLFWRAAEVNCASRSAEPCPGQPSFGALSTGKVCCSSARPGGRGGQSQPTPLDRQVLSMAWEKTGSTRHGHCTLSSGLGVLSSEATHSPSCRP